MGHIRRPANTSTGRCRNVSTSVLEGGEEDSLRVGNAMAPVVPMQQRRRSMNPIPIAVTVGGAYKYLEGSDSLLGHGTFGSVYRGNNVKTGETVAVKKLDNRKIKVDELSILRRLESEFVVGLMEVFVPDTEPFTYLIMEHCDTDLSKHLRRLDQSGGLTKQNLDIVISGLARGYEVLYNMSIIHMDIKPQNIMVCYENPEEESPGKIRIVKLSDFGSSRIANTSEATFTSLAGTPLYMAPEVGANVLDDSEYNHQVDMWSLGVVLYQCITGCVPFDEQLLCKLILYAATQNFKSYKHPDLPESIPAPYKGLTRSLLEIDSEQRLSPPDFVDRALTVVEIDDSVKPTTVHPQLHKPSVHLKALNGVIQQESEKYSESLDVPQGGRRRGPHDWKRTVSFDVTLVKHCEVKRHYTDLSEATAEEECSSRSSRGSSPDESPDDEPEKMIGVSTHQERNCASHNCNASNEHDAGVHINELEISSAALRQLQIGSVLSDCSDSPTGASISGNNYLTPGNGVVSPIQRDHFGACEQYKYIDNSDVGIDTRVVLHSATNMARNSGMRLFEMSAMIISCGYCLFQARGYIS